MKLIHVSEAPLVPVSHDPQLEKHVMVGQGELPAIKHICHIVLEAGSTAGLHQHPNAWEVFYCIRGAVWFAVNNEDVAVRAGHCFIVEPGESHSIVKTEETTEILYFLLDPGLKQASSGP